MKHIILGKVDQRLLYSVNQDCCLFCGMSGLQMMQADVSFCTRQARENYAFRQAYSEWRYQSHSREAR